MKQVFREFCGTLRKNGYEIDRVKGSHYIFTNGTNTIAVNKDIRKIMCQRLIKENSLVC